jgi:hypothetical protein
MIALYLLSALIMFILEYFVLLRIYKRSPTLEKISLIVAPIMIVVALLITNFIQTHLLSDSKAQIQRGPINPLLLFIVLVLLELPLSLYGYELTPDASIPERLVVAGSVGVVVVLIAQGILNI